MATKWSYSVGWRGYAEVKGVVVLATGANYSIEANPIYASGNTGKRYTRPASKKNFEQVSGSVDVELTGASYTCFTGFYAGADKSEGATINIYPAFGKGFVGRGWAESLSFSADADSLVTSGLGFRSHTGIVKSAAGTEYDKNDVITTLPEGQDPSETLSTEPDLNVIPYYDTKMLSSSTKITTFSESLLVSDVMSWSTEDSSEVTFIKLCNSTNEDNEPDYVLLGGSEASGNFTLFSVNKGSDYDKSYVGFQIGDKYFYSDGKIITESTQSSVQTGGSAITSEISFAMVGGVWQY